MQRNVCFSASFNAFSLVGLYNLYNLHKLRTVLDNTLNFFYAWGAGHPSFPPPKKKINKGPIRVPI